MCVCVCVPFVRVCVCVCVCVCVFGTHPKVPWPTLANRSYFPISGQKGKLMAEDFMGPPELA